MTQAYAELRLEPIDEECALVFDPNIRWFCELVYLKDDECLS